MNGSFKITNVLWVKEMTTYRKRIKYHSFMQYMNGSFHITNALWVREMATQDENKKNISFMWYMNGSFIPHYKCIMGKGQKWRSYFVQTLVAGNNIEISPPVILVGTCCSFFFSFVSCIFCFYLNYLPLAINNSFIAKGR